MQIATRQLQTGITLIELIFSLAITATLASISLPALGGLMQNSQSRNARSSLTTSLNLARINAVTRSSEVAVCPSANHVSCDDSTWWQHGWIVFVDSNHDGKRSADESIVEITDTQSAIAIASTAGRKHISFRSDGGSPGTNMTFTFCDRRGPAHAETVIVSNAGRARQGAATAAQASAACSGL